MDKAFQPTTGDALAGPTLLFSLIEWHGNFDEGCGDVFVEVDVSHWDADQFRRLWEFVHAN